MLAAIGDIVDDIVVRLGGPVVLGSDANALISRRRGGSAANVAAIAARLTGRSRFLGQVGDDGTADLLLAELTADGVDTSFVRRGGRSGAIVVLVDATGERSFLTDPGAARMLDAPEPAWLDGVDVLHVPFYSLVDEPLASTARTLAGWARDAGIPVSVDASSFAVIEQFGVAAAIKAIEALHPAALFANADEARVLGLGRVMEGVITFVKHGGSGPAVALGPDGQRFELPPVDLGSVHDTTGAGDAFAAGVLTTPGWRDDVVAAVAAGHEAAAAALRSRLT